MKVDRMTKCVLLLIAIGLWLNAISPLLQANSASASIESDIALKRIVNIDNELGWLLAGDCTNRLICSAVEAH
jgi:hypothetical protein